MASLPGRATADRPWRPGRLPSTSIGIAWERLARRWGEGGPPPSWISGCVASAGQALRGLACFRALPESLGTATSSEIYFGICSRLRRAKRQLSCWEGVPFCGSPEALPPMSCAVGATQGPHVWCDPAQAGENEEPFACVLGGAVFFSGLPFLLAPQAGIFPVTRGSA
jgi:hypothetical protein